MDTLRKLLLKECDYRMKEETMDRFLMQTTTSVELRGGKILMPYGDIDTNVYVVKSGIMRYAYFDGEKEITFGFALPGTMMMSFYSYLRDEPSFFQIEACCESVVLKFPRRAVRELLGNSHDFAQWMLAMSTEQLWLYERKLAVVNGDAKERLESLIRNRPEIMEKVSSRIIASYIGITKQYLSKLKRELGLL